MRKKCLAMIVAVACVVSLLAGCGSSTSGDSTSLVETEAEERADATEDQEKAMEGTGERMDDMVFEKGEWKIGVTLSANDNSFLAKEEENINEAKEYLESSEQVSEVQVAVADYDVSTQISQMQDFIMAGMDAIILDPVSGSALDGVIKEAYDAGIIVIVAQDGPVTSEYCYQMNYDLYQYGVDIGEFLVAACGEDATWLNIRGAEGSAFDENVQEGLESVIEEYNIEVAAELYCNWTYSVAQQKVSQIINSLPEIDAVSSQGGDSYGVAMAFENAGLEVPIIIGGNRGYFLNWWKDKSEESGYETLSVSADACDLAMAMYLAVDILNGYEVEQVFYIDLVKVTSEDLADIDIADEDIYSVPRDQDYVRENITFAHLK